MATLSIYAALDANMKYWDINKLL